MSRIATIHRNTRETQIDLRLNLDGKGKSEISTGIAFLITCWTWWRATAVLI